MAAYSSDEDSSEENYFKCCIFIDNSNLFIEGQKASAKRQQFNAMDMDFRFRINFKKFMDILIGERDVSHSTFYCSGHLPPKLWKILREKQIQVVRFPRNKRNHEKQVDTSLTAHVTRTAIEMKSLMMDPYSEINMDLTFVIVAGDEDYIPAFKQVMAENFKLEIFAWKDSISSKIRMFAEKEDYKNRVRIVHLDDYVTTTDSICFTADEWDESKFSIPPERSVVFKYTIGAPDPHLLNKQITDIIKLPCKYSQPDPDTIIIIILADKRLTLANITRLNDVIVTQSNAKTRYNIGAVINSLKRNYQKEMSRKILKILDYSTYLKSKPTTNSAIENSDERVKEEKNSNEDTVDDEDDATSKKYVLPCIYKYACNDGNNCIYFHSKKERLHFKFHPSLLGGKYKSRNCQNFENGACHFKVCVFAHGLKEARCYFCDPGGKVVGHWMEDCPNNKRTRAIDDSGTLSKICDVGPRRSFWDRSVTVS